MNTDCQFKDTSTIQNKYVINQKPMQSKYIINQKPKYDIMHRLLKKNDKKLARSFNVTYQYKYDVLSLHLQLGVTLLIASIPKNWKQYNTDRAMSASYHDIHLENNSTDGRLETKP